MCKKACKECPWTIRTQFNDMIIEHSKKYDKPHNCHMIPPSKRGGSHNLFNEVKEETKCEGRKQFEQNL